MHPPDHGHDGLAPVPRHAATLHIQGPRLHPRLLRHLAPEPRGAQEHPRNRERGAFPGSPVARLFLSPKGEEEEHTSQKSKIGSLIA